MSSKLKETKTGRIISMLLGALIVFGLIWAVVSYVNADEIKPEPKLKRYVICHHNKERQVTLRFRNLKAYKKHLKQPHNGVVYDTKGECEKPTPTPTDVPEPTPTEEPEPTPTDDPEPEPTIVPQPRTTTQASAPICPDFTPALVPANAHVIRDGSTATVNAHIPEGNQANVYYKENSSDEWTHALRDVPVTDGYLSVEINDLVPSLGYTFGVQAENSCAGGETIMAVVIDPPATGQTFMFSYWEWLR